VIDEQTADGQEVRVSKTSVCGSWGAIAGEVRYFADKFGIPRGSIEGTQVPLDLIRRYATRGAAELAYDPRRKHEPIVMRRRVSYFGFDLEREQEPLEEPWPAELAPQVRRTLAEALAREEARHVAVKRNRAAVEEVREMWRRSGARTPRLGFAELAALYESRLAGVDSLDAFRAADLRISADDFLPAEERDRLWALPSFVEVRGRDVEIDYDVEKAARSEQQQQRQQQQEADGAAPNESPYAELVPVARLRLPEKIARTLTAEELPVLDRPVRFVVLRGQRGAVRAQTLDELQELLDRPWSPDETDEPRARDGRDADGAAARPDERRVKAVAAEFRAHRDRDRQRRFRGRGDARPAGSRGRDDGGGGRGGRARGGGGGAGSGEGGARGAGYESDRGESGRGGRGPRRGGRPGGRRRRG
jgi:hypothetical protein